MIDPRDRIRARRYETEAEGYLEFGMPQHALDVMGRLGAGADAGARALYLKGEALRSLQRYCEALASLGQSALAAPHNVHVWLAIGWCRKRTGRLDLAIEALERAVEIEPGEALHHYNLACYLSLAEKKESALSHLGRALRIDPQYRILVDDEPDFDPLRTDPDFLALTSVIV